MSNIQLNQDLMSEDRVITLYEICKVLEKEHNKAIKIVEEMQVKEGFGLVAKITTKQKTGFGERDLDTYHYTEEQALMIGARLDSSNIIKLVNKLEEATKPMTVEQLLENNVKVIKQLQSENIVLVERNQVLEPKGLFADSVAQSEQSILIGQFAKVISDDTFKIGQNKLFEWLRENGYLIKSGNRKNQPTQQYIDNGWFEVTERTIMNPDGSTRLTLTTKIKGLGQVKITNKLKG